MTAGRMGSSLPLTPLTIFGSSLHFYLRSDLGIVTTLGTVFSSGTTPPAVTITGTPAITQTLGGTPLVEIDITGAGTGSAASFQWLQNGVVQQTGQSATSTFALGTTGLTANFPNSAYATDNVFKTNIVVSSWEDQVQGVLFTSSSVATSLIYGSSGGPLGQPTLHGLGASFSQKMATSTVFRGLGQSDWTVVSVHRFASLTVQNPVFINGVGGLTNLALLATVVPQRDLLCVGISNRNDTTSNATLNYEAWTGYSSAGTCGMQINGVQHTLSASTSVPRLNTTGGLTLAFDSVNFLNGDLVELFAVQRAPTAQQLSLLNTYLLSTYGLTFTPKNLGANLVAWYRSDLGITLNGSTVSQWVDQSTQGLVATQATANLQPTYSATGGINGLPKLTFAQSPNQTRLANTTQAVLPAGTQRSVFAVCQAAGAASGQNGFIFEFCSSGTTATFGYNFETATKSFTFTDSTAINNDITGTVSIVLNVLEWDYTVGGHIVFGINGVTQSGNTGGALASDTGGAGFCIGGRHGGTGSWVGDIYEIIVISGAISATDANSIRQYLGNRYGILTQ